MTDHDLQAEQAVLGALIISGGAALQDLADLDPADFYRPQHEELYVGLARMAKAGEPIDLSSASGVVDTIRGLDRTYVIELSHACTSWHSASYHAAKVSRLATMRRARAIGARLSDQGADLAVDPDALDAWLDSARAALDNLGAARQSEVSMFADVADEAINSIGQQRYTPTPWSGLNHVIDGWCPSLMYVLAARPATGKTVFAVQSAVDMARRGIGVAYYTFEMSGERLYQRAVAGIAGVDLKRMRRNELNEGEWRAIAKADGELRQLPVAVKGSAGWTAQQVCSHARMTHRKHPLGMVVVDHIGRVAAGSEKRYSREQEVADAANKFLDLSQELDAAILVVSQLNRESTKRSDNRPVTTDIRESDVLEHNADVVMLLHRDREKSPHELDLLIGKNRDGVDAPVLLAFEGAYARIKDRAWSPSGALGQGSAA